MKYHVSMLSHIFYLDFLFATVRKFINTIQILTWFFFSRNSQTKTQTYIKEEGSHREKYTDIHFLESNIPFTNLFVASDNIMQPENMDKILLEPNLSNDDVSKHLIIQFQV